MRGTVSPMLCRRLRAGSWRGVAPTLLVCFALIGGVAPMPSTSPEDETPSLAAAAHAVPLAALAESSGIRIEKQAQSHRLFIKKPERSGRVSPAERAPSLRSRTPTTQTPRSLPRCSLYSARSRPGPPDEPSDPLLS